MYSRGAAAIAEQLNCSKDEAQQIIDNFYSSFPTVKSWMDDSLAFLKKHGYTIDFYGRRRRLPDILLPKFSYKLEKTKDNFNPIIYCEDKELKPSQVLIEKYSRLLNIARGKNEIAKIQADALKNDGLIIQNNGGFIAQAERQCVNARIQGGAATMTKIAMNKIFRDPELNSYGFKLLINVHDELIGQCKEEYADKCAERLTAVMKTCISDICNVPFKCDPSIVRKWYFDEMAYQLQEEQEKMLKSGMSESETFDFLMNENSEFTQDEMSQLLSFDK